MARARLWAVLLPAGLALWLVFHGLQGAPAPALDGAARYPRADDLPAATLERGLRFAPGTLASDRAFVEAAIAGARPEARRLIAIVDGLVTVTIAVPGRHAVGTTQATRDGYAVVLDLAVAQTQHGERGIARVVLHELGHVVDAALLDNRVRAELDLAIPRGWGGCEEGASGACTSSAERFAETFAKWATGDIGIDLNFGYRVPPPASLDAWGAPLATLGGAAGAS